MRILKIEIEEFGKLRALTLEPASGLTLIEGENESGKSTLLAFLRFALYGFPRRGGAEGEERDRRLSWSGKQAAGKLTLETERGVFRIARRAYLRGRAAKEVLSEDLKVVELSSGQVLSLEGKSPGEYFLGLPPELYEGSLCITQTGADRVCAPGVGQAMGDLLFMDEHSFSAGDATTRLAQAHRDLRHLKGRGGRIPELEDRLAALDGDLERSRRQAAELARLRRDEQQCRAKLERDRSEYARVTAALEGAEIDRTLALFDERAAAVAEEARCRRLLEELGGEQLPDGVFSVRVASIVRRLSDERAHVARLETEVGLGDLAKSDGSVLRAAERIEALGGAAAVVQNVEKSRSKKKKCAITGVIFLILAIAAGVLGALLPALMIYALAGAGVAAFVALGCLCGAWRAHAEQRRLCGELGLPGGGMLRTHLEQIRREAELARQQESRRSALGLSLTAARQAVGELETQLRAEMATVGRTEVEPQAVAAYLEELDRRRRQYGTAHGEALTALERAKGVTEMLSRRLVGVDEAALRARRTALPAVTEVDGDLQQRQSELREAVGSLEQQCAELERARAVLTATVCDLTEVERARRAAVEELEAAKHRLAAVQMAQEAMERVCGELRRSITPRLAEGTAQLFDELTDGAHGVLRLSSDFAVTLEEDGIPRPLEHFSAGCRDAAHLALRLSLLGILSGEPLPLLFDEALARLDDRRAKALLRAIVRYCRGGGQCLLFTCHERERALLASEPDVAHFAMPVEG